MNSVPMHSDRAMCFFSPKRFQARVLKVFGEFDVEVQTPDLRRLDYTMSGDWGLMYRIELPLEESFWIRYSNADAGQMAQYSISPPTVGIEAPMRSSDRERHPFALKFMDVARGLQFRAMMNPAGEVHHVEVERVHIAFDVSRLLFREEARGRCATQVVPEGACHV